MLRKIYFLIPLKLKGNTSLRLSSQFERNKKIDISEYIAHVRKEAEIVYMFATLEAIGNKKNNKNNSFKQNACITIAQVAYRDATLTWLKVRLQ